MLISCRQKHTIFSSKYRTKRSAAGKTTTFWRIQSTALATCDNAFNNGTVAGQ